MCELGLGLYDRLNYINKRNILTKRLNAGNNFVEAGTSPLRETLPLMER